VIARQAARAEVVVDVSPTEAFELFTDEIGLWWRKDTPYWNDPERALAIRIEPGVGGRFIEVYDLDEGTGFEVGRVTAWEPGERLGVTWTQLGWPEGISTDIEVSFEAVDDGTLVRLEQTGFERVPDAEKSLAGYDAGWKLVLGWFAEHVTKGAGMKYLLFYEPVDDVLAKAPEHFPAHSARLDDFHARGELLMVGTFANPQEGSMSIFATRKAAEEFAHADPFVLNGVVRNWQIREWDEVLAPVPGHDALSVARAYHRAWTSGDFDRASAYLSPDLETDVPLNTYEDVEHWVEALTGFAQLVNSVAVITELGGDGEALLLYDLEVEGLGTLRVAEHFAVADGLITTIRHVHDTAALRAAGFAPAVESSTEAAR
jgi:uncharacterized protein